MTEVKKDANVYDISEVFEKFGKYHKIQYFYACLPAIFVTMININYVFVAGDVNYRCLVPECETRNSTAELPTWWPNTTTDKCTKPMLKEDFYLENNTCSKIFFTNTTVKCSSWIYESNNTMVSELDLACQPWKTNLVGSIHNIGMLFSMIISGWMSDRFGRKPTLIFCSIGGCVGHLKTIATSYYMYVAIEFMESAISGGTYAAAMVIMIEIGGKDRRVLAGVLFAYAVYLGESIFACIAMVIPYWKTLIRIIYTPQIIFLSYIFLLRESPRWQILNGKSGQAKKTIEFAAKMNKTNINTEELTKIDDVGLKEKFNIGRYEEREGVKDIFKSKEILKRVLVASSCRFTASFVYYGLMINSVWLPGNKYTNFLLATVMSFPGELMALYLMNKIGRKLPLILGYVVSGMLCVGSAYVPESHTWAKITLFLTGKMVISLCFTGAITYTMELFPTSVRGFLLGLCAFASRAGGMLAPLTPMLTEISEPLPSICFGGSALITGALLSLTPETKNMPLMDTIEQVETTSREAREIAIIKSGNVNYGYYDDTYVTAM